MKRLALAATAVVWLVIATVSAALAEWPTPCVELNDLIEASLGNDENVGIYQRVHGAQAEAACRADHGSDGFVFGGRRFMTPSRDNPAAYTQAFVERAIDRYDSQGLQATLDYYNTTDSVDGPWYVFIVNEAGITIGHHNPAFRNRDPSLRVDVTGYFYGDDLLAADENGRWVSYVFLNPSTGEQETKHAWAVRHEGLLFGSGWYER